MDKKLAFGELEAAAGAWLTGFLTLFHSRVAGQETGFFENRTQIGVLLAQSAGDGVTNCSGLTGDAATFGIDFDIKFLGGFRDDEGIKNLILEAQGGEVSLELTSVDFDLAGAGFQDDTGRGFFAASDCGGGLCGGHNDT